jgi:hypothetical protein
MSAYTFGAALELTSSPNLTSPPAVKRKEPTAPQSAIELEEYFQEIRAQHSRQSDGHTAAAAQASGKTPTATTKTPNELEMSRPPSPSQATEVMPSWGFPSMNRYRVLAVCSVYFANGINDACKCRMTTKLFLFLCCADMEYSCWCLDSLHGETIPYWLRDCLADLHHQRHWLHHRCFLYGSHLGEVG